VKEETNDLEVSSEESPGTSPRDAPEHGSEETVPSHGDVRDMSQVSQEAYENTEIRDYCVSELVSGTSYRALSEKLKEHNINIAKTTLWRLFPQTYIQEVRAQMEQQAQPGPQQIPMQQESGAPIPAGSIILTHQDVTTLRQGLNPQQKRVFDSMLGVASTRQNLAVDGLTPYRTPSGARSGEDAYYLELAKTERLERALLHRRKRNPDGDGGMKTLLEAIKVVTALRPNPGSVDTLGIYRMGRGDQKTEVGRSGSTNITDLKLEELRESHDLDMARLGFEQKKFFLKMEHEDGKWDKISETFGPILQTATPEIRKAIRQIGESVGRGLQPKPQPDVQAATESVTCPKCGRELKVNIPEGLEKIGVVCPQCKHKFLMGQVEEEPQELRPKSKLSYKDA